MGLRGDNKYQYNEKELNDDYGLDWNDYGARFYDASIGRFPTVDPLAEGTPQWNTYNYVGNNPITFTDPTGMSRYGEEEENKIMPQNTLPQCYCGSDGGKGQLSDIYLDANGNEISRVDNKSASNPNGDDHYYRGTKTAKGVSVTDDLGESAPEISSNEGAGNLIASLHTPEMNLLNAQIAEHDRFLAVQYSAGAQGFAGTLGITNDPIFATVSGAGLFAGLFRSAGPQANRIAGNAFRDEIAAILQSQGRTVATEVSKKTPFGWRYIDIEVSQGGRILGGIETKLGGSPYKVSQRAKDYYLKVVEGYPVNVIRKP